MLEPGVYPASVTPFDAKGRVDLLGVAKLLAWFEACGCKGVVLAGTNGEGPSLSAPEKRDLMLGSLPLLGGLTGILGIATPSLDEAIWLTKQGASAVLLMPPYYFKPVGEIELRDWFLRVLDASPVPVLVYNFPQKTGLVLTPSLLESLSEHPRMLGAKDSSGEPVNLVEYRQALPSKLLFVGDETLLLEAMRSGWTGTISGAANVLGDWLSQIVMEFSTGMIESAETKFELILPCIQALRKAPQPATNKALLVRRGILDRADVRLPLRAADATATAELDGLILTRTGK